MANVTYYELNNIDQVHYQEAEILDKYSVELLQLEKLRKITLADGHILITEMIKKAKKNYSAHIPHFQFIP